MADHRITIRDKSGEMFDVMGPARHADTGQELTIYRSLKDARVLALPTAEFRGRFTLEHFRDDRAAGGRVGLTPPEFQEVSWGVDAVMRPVKGMAVSECAFRQWCEENGIALAASPSVQNRGEGETGKDGVLGTFNEQQERA